MRKPVPPSGASGLFHPKEHDECPSVEFRVKGKLLKMRMQKGRPVGSLDDDTYCGKETPRLGRGVVGRQSE